MTTALARVLKKLREPMKLAVQERAKDVARQLSPHYPRYFFQERGALWSPYIMDVSEPNLQLFGSPGGPGVERDEADMLMTMCSDHHFAYFKGGRLRNDGVDSSFQPNREELQAFLKASDHNASFVCHGPMWVGDFLMPFDVSLCDGPGNTEQPMQRMSIICQSAADKDYANVLQKVSALLQGRRGKETKRILVDHTNQQLGKTRFLEKQLDMILGLEKMEKAGAPGLVNPREYCYGILRITDQEALEDMPALLEAAKAETQLRARRILVEMRDRLVTGLKLGSVLGKPFRKATEHVAQNSKLKAQPTDDEEDV
ncbi:hypothetical protein M885DRAFT_522370 [Pelagophyceae sp. CCMP2097]|nr:hypothetical protein M885DRAFT_522370 [Pelagophyceae sp. CCMP2097]